MCFRVQVLSQYNRQQTLFVLFPLCFFGYSENHKGYRCLDRASNHLIISRHVTFDEPSFPFVERCAPIPSSEFDFLSEFDVMSIPIGSSFPTRVCVGTGSPGVCGTLVQLAPTAPGAPLCPGPVGASGPQAHLPRGAPDFKSPSLGVSSPASPSMPCGSLTTSQQVGSSAHLLEQVRSVAVAPSAPTDS
jgi:hypothetical protein